LAIVTCTKASNALTSPLVASIYHVMLFFMSNFFHLPHFILWPAPAITLMLFSCHLRSLGIIHLLIRLTLLLVLLCLLCLHRCSCRITHQSMHVQSPQSQRDVPVPDAIVVGSSPALRAGPSTTPLDSSSAPSVGRQCTCSGASFCPGLSCTRSSTSIFTALA
jgi:hypothetical protein